MVNHLDHTDESPVGHAGVETFEGSTDTYCHVLRSQYANTIPGIYCASLRSDLHPRLHIHLPRPARRLYAEKIKLTHHPFKMKANVQTGGLPAYTTSNGCPIMRPEQSRGAGENLLLTDFHLIDLLSHFNREKIPERVVHARGAGAYGEFEVRKSQAPSAALSTVSQK